MIKIFPAETSLGSSSPGAEKAPAVLIQKGFKPALKHNSFDYEVFSATQDGPATQVNGDEWPHNVAQIIDFNKRLYENIISHANDKDIVLTVGGDHSVGAASMFATKLRFENAVVVYIDAHPDCTSPDTTLTGNVHGMQLATVLGDSLYKDFNFPRYSYDQVFLLGIKDIDPAELEYLHGNHILHIHMDEVTKNGIAAALEKICKHIQGRPVHVSLDIDSIDVSEAPGTGIINKGGLSYREASYLCRHLSEQDVVAVDVVEVNSDRDVDAKTQALATELTLNLLGAEWSPYTQYIMSKH